MRAANVEHIAAEIVRDAVAATVESYGHLDPARLLKTVHEEYPGSAKNARLTRPTLKRKRA